MERSLETFKIFLNEINYFDKDKVVSYIDETKCGSILDFALQNHDRILGKIGDPSTDEECLDSFDSMFSDETMFYRDVATLLHRYYDYCDKK